MKTVMQFFAEELLPYFGIEGKAIRIAPTELIHLEVKKLFEDFNLEMEDGSWIHFVFRKHPKSYDTVYRRYQYLPDTTNYYAA